jgi:hypothetical protein
MNMSEHINEIATAIAKAQATLVNPSKDSENPHFKSKYAGLAEALVGIRKELSAVGVATIQSPCIVGDMQILDTRLVHSSGQWIGCEWPIGRVGSKPHDVGSGLTYARRYSLFSLVGIAGADDDDDGNAASGKTPAPQVEERPVRCISDTELYLIQSGIEALTDKSIEKVILDRYGIASLRELTSDKLHEVTKAINARFAKQEAASKKMAAE